MNGLPQWPLVGGDRLAAAQNLPKLITGYKRCSIHASIFSAVFFSVDII